MDSATKQRLREVCHDLRQPLATISVLADLIAASPDVPQSLRRRVLQVVSEARLMSDLLGTLITNQGDAVRVDLTPLTKKVVDVSRLTYNGTIRMFLESSETVMVDEFWLRRSFATLMDNSVRAAGEGGFVLVRVRRMGNYACWEVEDSGAPTEAQDPSESHGFPAIDRVAESFGGHLEIFEGDSLGGALLRLSLPRVK
ncbi:MAG: sensor histidine kinase [Actinomycetota bacterium]